MRVIIHNRKYNDEIVFENQELTEELKEYVLSEVHTRGWEDEDCWSEVKEN